MATLKTKLVCLEDYEQAAASKLKKSLRNYYSDGSCLGLTKTENVAAYKRYNILPRILHGVDKVDTSSTLLGQKVTFPIGVAPLGRLALAHPDGEVAAGRACTEAGVCMIQSILSNKSIEEVTEAHGLRWMQVQPIQDHSIVVDVVQRAEKSGYKAIVVTCDQPSFPIRYSNMRECYTETTRHFETFGNFSSEVNKLIFVQDSNYIEECFFESTSWDWIDWLRSLTHLPIVLKGLLRPDDAREALRHDIQAIIVSNHGGRNLDEVPATIDVLSEIIDAVDGKVEVYVDGGIRHGTDVFKALALGAKAVFIGRPIIWGLACDGEDGAQNILKLLGNEFYTTMSYAGCSSVADITPDFVRCAK